MEIIITGQHTEITDTMRDYAMEKVKKLEHYLDNIIKIHVILKRESTRAEKMRNIAHADLHVRGLDISADAEADDMYAAIDALSDKLLQQAKKIKFKS